MTRQHMFNNCESEPSPAELSRARAIDAIKPFRQAIDMMGGDTRSRVRYFEVHTTLVGVPLDYDSAPSRRVLHGVEYKIGKRTVQLAPATAEQKV